MNPAVNSIPVRVLVFLSLYLLIYFWAPKDKERYQVQNLYLNSSNRLTFHIR